MIGKRYSICQVHFSMWHVDDRQIDVYNTGTPTNFDHVSLTNIYIFLVIY